VGYELQDKPQNTYMWLMGTPKSPTHAPILVLQKESEGTLTEKLTIFLESHLPYLMLPTIELFLYIREIVVDGGTHIPLRFAEQE
jgi:hypothetical protein